MNGACLLILPAVCLMADASWGESPYRRPQFERLMDAVTFHVSFDADSMTPDMAEAAEYEPKVYGPHSKATAGPQFADGLIGRALVLGAGGAVYPRVGNVPMERRGAIALWVRPHGWQRPRDGNCVFAMTSNAKFYLQRQGPLVDDDGKVRRHEGVQYLVFVPDQRTPTLTAGSTWKNDKWYLLVANWSWPTFELSVDGGPFQVRSLAAVPPQGNFGSLVLGDRSGNVRGLIDEVMAFRRPLRIEEARLLYGLGK